MFGVYRVSLVPFEGLCEIGKEALRMVAAGFRPPLLGRLDLVGTCFEPAGLRTAGF